MKGRYVGPEIYLYPSEGLDIQSLISQANDPIRAHHWSAGKAGGIVSDYRVASSFALDDASSLDPKVRLHQVKVHEQIQKGLEEISKENPFLSISHGESFTLVKYGVGGKYGPHVDFQPTHPKSRSPIRQISVVMYLTDPDNYEGGEIHFPRQNITLKPKPGEIIYFPSCYTHVHEVKPVTKGERYVILTILS